MLPPECDYMPTNADWQTFNGFAWTRTTSEHWEVPICACIAYLFMIFSMKRIMKHKEKVPLKSVVVVWNFSLSFFSLCGLIYCVPHLLFGEFGLFTAGFYPSVCTHASSYGMGKVGFFVFLFIYSKLAELLDTFWLLLRKSPVILLHWYHHVTVLLYCWHAYSIRIGTGLWFASMNYTVHAIMYFYFGLTQLGPKGRATAKRFSMLVTLLQLTQMVVGILVTVASVYYHYIGRACFVSITNSALGLIMYSSYFVLFLQLFLSHYVYNKKEDKPAKKNSSSADEGEAYGIAAEAANKARPPARRVKQS